ncbi:MAG: DNA-binding protein [Candidatus Roseilinea sp.]|nr:MAG: DNA-binding protein [Candidatus Roseilinea sp.]
MTDPLREAGRWWRQAVADFAFLPVARDAGKFDTCCFLAQQTAEKALKAYLFAQGEELVFTHSIFRLCDLAARYDAAFTDLREDVKRLDFYYYVEARYPNAIEDVIPAEFYSDRDAEEAIRMANAVCEFVGRRLSFRDDSERAE